MNRILTLALCSEPVTGDNVNPLVAYDKPPEEVIPNDKTIIMSGPLSEVYTKALQVVYAKTNPVEGLVATESQANDAIMQVAVLKALELKKNGQEESIQSVNVLNTPIQEVNPHAVVYASYANDFTINKAITVTGSLAKTQRDNPDSQVILVIDGGDDGSGSYVDPLEEGNELEPMELNNLKEAVESLCQSAGIKLHYSFESFVSSLRSNSAK